jgi:hypothetical protein
MWTVKSINWVPIANIKSINGLAIANVKSWNGLALPVAVTWVSDDFSGGTLDTGKWTSHITTSGTISVASSELQLTRPATNTYNYLDSVSTQNSEIIFAQAYMSWDTNDTNEDIAGIMITSTSTPTHGWWPNYSAQINTRDNIWGWHYRLWVNTTSRVYNLDTDSALTKWQEVKITFNTSNNEIKFWRWTWSWTQMWTTQTYDIKNGGNLKLIIWYDYIATSIWTAHIDNLYFGRISADYSTQYPV